MHMYKGNPNIINSSKLYDTDPWFSADKNTEAKKWATCYWTLGPHKRHKTFNMGGYTKQ